MGITTPSRPYKKEKSKCRPNTSTKMKVGSISTNTLSYIMLIGLIIYLLIKWQA